jgi:bifunctional DNA-binding transcriptional regulator/antitoxin component of YhaV-PrlF toxin-antitoxin module
MTITYVVGSKGQIVISKDIRDKLGVESGWIAIQRLVGDHVEMYLFPPEHNDSLKGSLRAHLKGKVAEGGEWDAAREAAWTAAARGKTS